MVSIDMLGPRLSNLIPRALRVRSSRLRHNFQKYPLTPPILRRGAGANFANTFENRLSIPLRFI